jgi:hypothetical protein
LIHDLQAQGKEHLRRWAYAAKTSPVGNDYGSKNSCQRFGGQPEDFRVDGISMRRQPNRHTYDAETLSSYSPIRFRLG